MIILTAKGKDLNVIATESITSGSVGLTATLTTDAAWAGLTVTVVFRVGTTEKIAPLRDGVYTVPWELLIDANVGKDLQAGICGMSGTDIVYPTVYAFVGTIREGADPNADPSATPTPSAYQTILNLVQQEADSATSAAAQAVIAVAKALEAAASATNAKTSESAAAQALSDLLAMMGVDLATLTGGKVPMSQLPATATLEIYEVASEDELVTLVAQRGDRAELIATVDGERTTVKAWQLLGDDASVRDNWVVCGTSYAVQAGNATTATNAANADAVNGHRMVRFASIAELDAAVKVSGTIYYAPYAQE